MQSFLISSRQCPYTLSRVDKILGVSLHSLIILYKGLLKSVLLYLLCNDTDLDLSVRESRDRR